MSYIAVDSLGDESIFHFQPVRKTIKTKLGETYGYWYSEKDYGIHVPKGTAKALFNANLLINCNISLYKRDMNWGDNPIQLKY